MNILHINTTDNKKIILYLKTNHGKNYIEKGLQSHRSQLLLPCIVDLLKKNSLTFADLSEITVHKGPGAFTGVRVGVAVANAIGFALRIPVNGQKTPVEPIYS